MSELICGIDPSSTSSGISILTTEEELVEYRSIPSPSKEYPDPFDRLRIQIEGISEVMNKYELSYIFCEDQYLQNNPKTLKMLSNVCGAVMGLALMKNNSFQLFEPTKWRSIAMNKGSAKKEETIIYMNEYYDLKLKKKDNDIADAIGIGLAGVKWGKENGIWKCSSK